MAIAKNLAAQIWSAVEKTGGSAAIKSTSSAMCATRYGWTCMALVELPWRPLDPPGLRLIGWQSIGKPLNLARPDRLTLDCFGGRGQKCGHGKAF
ncbi:hypothetical protein NL676_013941 [Syzygium grande]|nr:hypothetical protein NL676_013941 [Syzygium grande]